MEYMLGHTCFNLRFLIMMPKDGLLMPDSESGWWYSYKWYANLAWVMASVSRISTLSSDWVNLADEIYFTITDQENCRKTLKSFQKAFIQFPLLLISRFLMYMCYLFLTVFESMLQACHLSLLHFRVFFLKMGHFSYWTVPLSSQEIGSRILLLFDLLTLFRLHHLSH